MHLERVLVFPFCVFLLIACKPSTQEQMAAVIAAEKVNDARFDNIYNPKARIVFLDSVLKHADASTQLRINYQRAKTFMELGDINKTVALFTRIRKDPGVKDSEFDRTRLQKELAFAYLRMGEVNNCLSNHNAESCIFPIQGGGIHKDSTGSAKAIALYKQILERDPSDIESIWLLNIAYMTLGKYPAQVPKQYLLMEDTAGTEAILPFEDIAADLNVDLNNGAGGVIVEDFDNDGYLDMVTSAWNLEEPMHFFRNNANGTFSDLSKQSGLNQITGGLNIMQTDFNNDGFKDIFVLRGAWKSAYGRQHNSLLKNNGNVTFTEVTIESGLLSAYPTQAATWNDFNNDGWVDVFIGNETSMSGEYKNPCELYINNRDGTFSNKAKEAKVDLLSYVKGVTSGDFDNDGWQAFF